MSERIEQFEKTCSENEPEKLEDYSGECVIEPRTTSSGRGLTAAKLPDEPDKAWLNGVHEQSRDAPFTSG